MIIFGSKWIRKILGTEGSFRCTNCNNVSNWQLVKLTLWFSLFFIPIIPIKSEYYEVCPICGGEVRITKEECMSLIQKSNE